MLGGAAQQRLSSVHVHTVPQGGPQIGGARGVAVLMARKNTLAKLGPAPLGMALAGDSLPLSLI